MLCYGVWERTHGYGRERVDWAYHCECVGGELDWLDWIGLDWIGLGCCELGGFDLLW